MKLKSTMKRLSLTLEQPTSDPPQILYTCTKPIKSAHKSYKLEIKIVADYVAIRFAFMPIRPQGRASVMNSFSMETASSIIWWIVSSDSLLCSMEYLICICPYQTIATRMLGGVHEASKIGVQSLVPAD